MPATMRKFTLLFILYSLAGNAYADSVKALAFQLKASVVKVHTATKSGGHGVGTGVVVAKDLVATNCHVIANASGVKITKFGESYSPDAIKADWKHDLCLLRIQYLQLTPVQLGDSESLKYEQDIFSIGFPGGPPKPQTTEGKIKALYPLDDSSIVRTDASFVMGASGSPVFDLDGKLIAISTFKSPGRGAYYYNIPVKWVQALLDAPELTSLDNNIAPFWDASDENRPYFMRVVIPYQNEEWAALKKIAQDWIVNEPNTTEAYYYAAVAEEKLGNGVKANEYYQQVLKLQPQHPPSLTAMKCSAKATLEC